MTSGRLKALYRLFCEVEAANQELFAKLKKFILQSIVGFAGVVGFLYNIGWDQADWVLEVATLIIAVFLLLVLYRVWEALKFEFTSPFDS